MSDPEGIRSLVQDAINQGASTVEEVHKKIASMPLDALKQVEPLAGVAESAQEITNQTIGAVYDAIRTVNDQVGQIASQLLGRTGGGSGEGSA